MWTAGPDKVSIYIWAHKHRHKSELPSSLLLFSLPRVLHGSLWQLITLSCLIECIPSSAAGLPPLISFKGFFVFYLSRFTGASHTLFVCVCLSLCGLHKSDCTKKCTKGDNSESIVILSLVFASIVAEAAVILLEFYRKTPDGHHGQNISYWCLKIHNVKQHVLLSVMFLLYLKLFDNNSSPLCLCD